MQKKGQRLAKTYAASIWIQSLPSQAGVLQIFAVVPFLSPLAAEHLLLETKKKKKKLNIHFKLNSFIT